MAYNKVFIKNFIKKILKSDQPVKKQPLTEKQLKVMESEIGARIFGPIAPNERREFFNDNERSWFFHQEIVNKLGLTQSVTLHYEVHPNGILRISSREDTKNEFISGQELDNFMSAIQIYYERVMKQIYNRDVSADKKAA